MPASAVTLARCLDLTGPSACPNARTAATQQLARQRADLAAGLRPYRAYNKSILFWIVARVLAATDTAVTVRYLRTDGTHATAELARPADLDIPADARVTTTVIAPLTAEIAARHLDHRVELFDAAGDPIDATLLEIDGDHVLLRRHDRADRLMLRQVEGTSILLEVPTRHTIGYSRGSVDVGGTEYVDPLGRPQIRQALLYSAWCSCGEFRHHDPNPGPRRYAVKAHLRASAELLATLPLGHL
ncbi:hypothetical protein JNUCC0626_50450 (plasmid) [Lentzea sp. JNUCC 0626]|uniref:hypothetical protein n=1 Tax=Lentzea sp. JNUCC 0626 TaxID=3367513 RepID=UPI003748260C